jgi:hypothetical protein
MAAGFLRVAVAARRSTLRLHLRTLRAMVGQVIDLAGDSVWSCFANLGRGWGPLLHFRQARQLGQAQAEGREGGAAWRPFEFGGHRAGCSHSLTQLHNRIDPGRFPARIPGGSPPPGAGLQVPKLRPQLLLQCARRGDPSVHARSIRPFSRVANETAPNIFKALIRKAFLTAQGPKVGKVGMNKAILVIPGEARALLRGPREGEPGLR